MEVMSTTAIVDRILRQHSAHLDSHRERMALSLPPVVPDLTSCSRINLNANIALRHSRARFLIALPEITMAARAVWRPMKTKSKSNYERGASWRARIVPRAWLALDVIVTDRASTE